MNMASKYKILEKIMQSDDDTLLNELKSFTRVWLNNHK